MANSKDRFQKAIRESFDQLLANGEKKITKTKIIENAKFEDGSSVGKTTLYAKNAVTKDPIHATLIDELNEKIANLPKNNFNKKKTSIETNKELKLRIKELEDKNNQLLTQLVEMESSFENTAHRNDENQIQNLESQLYILAFLLNSQIVGRRYKELDIIIKTFEAKYHGKQVAKVAKEQIQKMKNEIECSKVISMKGSFKED
ncbi:MULTISPECIES: AAA family ATPase [Acinetobacter]|uniref:Uncharacterized protein n=2 Tax=Acinetobacter calcoaceticus/baumannii complex TaxID=909768 RepID=A0A241ZFV6_ACIBA|nr:MULTISPECIES: hypothetical protein [Acinetobacter]MDU5818002.1 hypothetical protein [Staphylococcus sp.]EKU50950.1 hypothetical protein ACINWC487_3760 [Acinetobacter nosocomialis]ELW80200.1 hypothetical protein ACINWCA92_3623 [Acinetobacter baumannii WC-A-92]EXH73829.1 hypothetical protein J633_3965 [Acinetobacter sp. 216872]KDM52524.1 hypothetical protein AE32_03541 [Acinetobacter nosocomialis]